MKLPMHLSYNQALTANAKRLRNDMTDAERKLWYQYLHGHPIRFTRQKIINNCILDFYCSKCRLEVELDGSQHRTVAGLAHDEARSLLLNAYGVTVIRFSNEQVSDHFGEVCHQIDQQIKNLLNRKKL
jgi:very-short-patch-repair endonuclease